MSEPRQPDESTPLDLDADYITGDGGLTREMLDRRPVQPRTVNALYETRPKLNPTQAIKTFVEQVELQERYGHLRVVDDLVGLQRRVGDRIERYMDKLQGAEAKSGTTESAKFGIGHFAG